MHELNISSPFSLARLFLTQQLISKSKIEKHIVFRNYLLGEITISYIRTDTPFFGSGLGICVACPFEVDKNEYQKFLGT